MRKGKMFTKKVISMAERLSLPGAVLPALATAAETLPDSLPTEELVKPETASPAWQVIAAQLPAWQEDNGMAQLAVMLSAVSRTEEYYQQNGIPEDIFFSTMDCFRRFLEETHARTGQWAFDRGFWTWRQTGGLLFRLGTLEFECRRAGPGPLPQGLEADAPVLGVHIPSDAVLGREELDEAYDMALQILSWESLCLFGRPEAVICNSWLLAPALAGLLPEGSGIRCFAGDYRCFAVDEENREFYMWLFDGCGVLEDLPERTSLQRAVKARLATGGRLGAGRGVLKWEMN